MLTLFLVKANTGTDGLMGYSLGLLDLNKLTDM